MSYSIVQQRVFDEFHLKYRQAKEQGLSPKLLKIGAVAATILEMHYDLRIGSFQDPSAVFYGMKIQVLKYHADAFVINVLS